MHPVIITDEATIREIVARATEEALKDTLPGAVRAATRKDFLTREEVEDLTGWSGRTLQHLRDTRQIAFVQHGRKILYPSKELHAFLDSHRVIPREKRAAR